MIIISQDKTRIYNFERVSEIVVSGTEICISDSLRQEEGLVIATYETEERAKEVLQEIYCKYEHGTHLLSSKSLSVQNIMDYDFIYEMPKE